MKVAILFALFVAVALAAQGTCPTLTCVGKGKTCNQVVGSSGLISAASCNSGSLGCEYTTVETNFTGTCASLPGKGKSCLVSGNQNLCADELTCTGSTCEEPVATKYPGEGCSGTDKCNPKDGTATTVACPTSGTCDFVADGSACVSTGGQQCNYLKSYCKLATGTTSGTCTARIADGTACTVGVDSCSWYSACAPTATTGTDGKCAALYSVAAGQPCITSDACVRGLFCGARATGDIFGKCTAPVSSNHKACETVLDCATDGSESCGCNAAISTTGTICLSNVEPASAQSAANDLLNCAKKNNCYNDGDCLSEHCKGNLCGSIKSNPDLALGCGSFCNSAATATAVVSYFALATLAAFVLL